MILFLQAERQSTVQIYTSSHTSKNKKDVPWEKLRPKKRVEQVRPSRRLVKQDNS